MTQFFGVYKTDISKKMSLKKLITIVTKNKEVKLLNFLKRTKNRGKETTQNEEAVPVNKSKTKSSLLFVNVINFELTYKCSFNCVHCLQKNIKKQDIVELSTEEVKTAILHSHISGLCSLGINFTGGEILGNRDDIFEILDFTRSLGIRYRLNTNSWWANENNLRIGKYHFSSARHLVDYIKSLEIEMFAFSCDLRLNSTINWRNLISSVKLCEEIGIYYQLIFTGLEYNAIRKIIFSLNETCGKLRYLIPAIMEMVDIGGGAAVNKKVFCHQSNKSYCNKKGFYRPNMLHISPDGKVRTCLYAIGLNDCGNLRQMSMIDIVKNFPHRANNDLFSDPIKYEKAEKELFLPYRNHYQHIIHECTRFSVIARTAEMKTKYPQMKLNEIHTIIAKSISDRKKPFIRMTQFLGGCIKRIF
jgi:MoaA/NifB/PqqE/SkfB family radical SAM enzyme